MRALFTFTIFLGAFLLFLVQPLFAKILLPMLGGSASVWNTAMLFYQTTLLLGYLYAHLSTRGLGLQRQIPWHWGLLVAPAITLPIGTLVLGRPPSSESPILWMLLTMLLGVGLPFFVLSTTSPLIQRWFSATGDPAAKDPYFLYSASNVGSMLSLIAYPVILEPNLKVLEQSFWWSGAYIVFAALMAVCGVVARRAALQAPPSDQATVPAEEEPAPHRNRILKWIALALVPSSLMIGVTTFVSTDLAVVPLLWAIPLGLYLLTFIVAFATRPLLPHTWVRAAFPFVLAALVLVMAVPIKQPGELVIGLHLLCFFLAAMLCHGELAKDRPSPRHLTAFYLWISVGGALGGAFNALIAPVLFTGVYEYPLMILLVGLLMPLRSDAKGWRPPALDVALPALLLAFVVGAVWLERRYGLTSSNSAFLLILSSGALACILAAKRPLRFALCLGALLLAGRVLDTDPRQTLFAGRSFFGVYKVQDDPSGAYRYLMHGRINHGAEGLREENRARPLSYYFPTGPSGQLFRLRERPAGARIGIVGMGIGSLLNWARPGETWDLFEICPLVADLAKDPRFFTVLNRSEVETNVILGDARLKLAESETKYDILVMDAFTGDSIPAHLITREAIQLYFSRLKPDGVLLINVTNKHMHFEPLLAALASDLGLECRLQEDFHLKPGERSQGKAESAWAVMARTPRGLCHIARDVRWREPVGSAQVRVWTDDYSSILSILRAL